MNATLAAFLLLSPLAVFLLLSPWRRGLLALAVCAAAALAVALGMALWEELREGRRG